MYLSRFFIIRSHLIKAWINTPIKLILNKLKVNPQTLSALHKAIQIHPMERQVFNMKKTIFFVS